MNHVKGRIKEGGLFHLPAEIGASKDKWMTWSNEVSSLAISKWI
jgi:hypothetical protein